MRPEQDKLTGGSQAPHPGTEGVFRTHSPQATIQLGCKLAGSLRPGDCVGLAGPLGAGKTALVKGIAAGCGLDDLRLVCSPTFVLVREYPCTPRIYHVDLYRLTQPGRELFDLGLEEMLADGIVLVEWANRAEDALPRPRWEVRIEITGRRSRTITVRRLM